jgi:transaldolase
MAVEKLQQGIDGFSADQRKLEDLIAGLVASVC